MLTQAELQAMENARAAAEAEVGRLERAADASSSFPGLLFPTDEQRAASAARATLAAIVAARNDAIERGDREAALAVVENARRLARSGSTAAALADNTVGDVAAAKLPGAIAQLAGRFGWALVVLLVVLALGASGLFLAQVRALVPRRA